MELATKYFSAIAYEEDEVITFEAGIFGFEDYRRFVLIRFDNASGSVICLQSVEEANVAFVMINPHSFLPDYEFTLSDEDIRALKVENAEDVMIYNICVLQDNLRDSTANLKCPIVVNVKNRLARQIILEDGEYPFKYPFSKLIPKEG